MGKIEIKNDKLQALSYKLLELGPFGLGLFWSCAKQLMQTNKFLCIIHKFVNVVYEKTVYKETTFVSEKL